MANILRNDRVTVTTGSKKTPAGLTGIVFWSGTGQWGPRIGFKTSDGVTYWAKPSDVSVEGAPALIEVPAATSGPSPLDLLTARVAALEALLAGAPAPADVPEAA